MSANAFRKRRGTAGASALLALAALTLFLGACGPSVRATVTISHELPYRPPASSYAFIPFKDQDVTPENAVYRNLIKTELARYRFRETDETNAAYLLSFSYGIDGGRERTDGGFFGTETWTEYRKGLWVFLFEKGTTRDGGQKVIYEGNVMSAGPLAQLRDLMPAMIRELFFDFPGERENRRVVVLDP